jgi:hypothetical protein
MGLKHIGLKGITNPKGDIIICTFHLSRCLNGKGEKTKTLGEWKRLHSMEMDSLGLFLPMLCIDMDFVALLSHPGAEVNYISFRTSLAPGEVPNGCGKSHIIELLKW